PDPPTIVGVIPRNGGIGAVFTPGDDGGSAITAYVLSCASSDGGVASQRIDGGSPIILGGLTNGKHYTCTVHARKRHRDSEESNESASVVPNTLPDQPAPPTLTADPANTSISVAFVPPNNSGSDILYYTAVCTSSDGGDPGFNTEASSPIVVPGLTVAAQYT